VGACLLSGAAQERPVLCHVLGFVAESSCAGLVRQPGAGARGLGCVGLL